MVIVGFHEMSDDELEEELRQGAKFVVYQYCISVLILTFKRPSDIYYIPPGGSAMTKGLRYSLLSFLAGWWGIPWGPIYTIGSLVSNFRGGRDVTGMVLNGRT